MLNALIRQVKESFGRAVPTGDRTGWTRCYPDGPVRLKDGTLGVPGSGQIWMRRHGESVQYRQDLDEECSDCEMRNIDWD